VDVPAEFYGESPEAGENLVVKAQTYVDKAQQIAESAGIKAEAFFRDTETWQAIMDMADEKKADTIIMGSHGRTGLKRLLMGSVTEKVIGHAPCPVIVVKA